MICCKFSSNLALTEPRIIEDEIEIPTTLSYLGLLPHVASKVLNVICTMLEISLYFSNLTPGCMFSPFSQYTKPNTFLQKSYISHRSSSPKTPSPPSPSPTSPSPHNFPDAPAPRKDRADGSAAAAEERTPSHIACTSPQPYTRSPHAEARG
jgi:hypothetical protein